MRRRFSIKCDLDTMQPIRIKLEQFITRPEIDALEQAARDAAIHSPFSNRILISIQLGHAAAMLEQGIPYESVLALMPNYKALQIVGVVGVTYQDIVRAYIRP